MAEWASLDPNQRLRREKFTVEGHLWPMLLGVLIARGSILGLYPFGIGFGAALLLNGRKGMLSGLLGICFGLITLVFNDLTQVLQAISILLVLSFFIKYLRNKKREGILLGLLTAVTTAVISIIMLSFSSIDIEELLRLALWSILNGGLAIIFWYALRQQDAIWSGEFSREQGMAWLLILIGIISGLQGLRIGSVDFAVVLMSFFILFVAERFGAGAAAGVGAMLGFLPQLEVNVQNLMEAGIYGLAGFGTGAFQKISKIVIALAYLGIMLMLSVYYHPDSIYPQIVSVIIGIFLFLVFPRSTKKTDFLKIKPMPEVESTVTKVKTIADIFNQISYSAQAAESEVSKSKPEISELMNVLVERVCKTCPTIDTCWTREFYKTYHFMFNLFELIEKENEIDLKDLPKEWKVHCGRLKEMLLGVQFIIEHEKNLEAWKSRLTANQEALSRQFQSVSQVIGHLAKELNERHNVEPIKPSSLERRRRQFIDLGVGSFAKTGNALSGDNYASIAFSSRKHAFVVSDGMGMGESAAKLSSTALNLLEQLLSTGFEAEGAIQALNSILVLKSPEESFVTLDLGIIDLESDELKLLKVGACPSYIKRKNSVEVIESSSLPVGILNHIDVPVITEFLYPNEYLVLVTDGIQDILKNGTDWLKGFLETHDFETSQELANEIVKEAYRLNGEELYDDGIVLVVKKNILS